jgi:transcriptional regulator with XRE-family HTH domain
MMNQTAPERVAAAVRELAKALNITQSALARAMHTTQQTVSRKLNGEIPFRLEELDALADVLRTTADHLVKRTPKA